MCYYCYFQEQIDYAERQCKATENFISVTEKGFKDQLDINKQDLQDIQANISVLFSSLPQLNDLVCDGEGNLCDAQCGGAGCDSCGGGSIACENGAKHLAETALSIATDIEKELFKQETKANDFIRNVSQINTNITKNVCQDTYDKAQQAFIKSNKTLSGVNALQYNINEFFKENNSKPEDVRELAEKVCAIYLFF